MTNKETSIYLYMSAAFVAALVTANVLAGKIIVIGGIFVPAGVLAYSITFAITDTVCEIWGKEKTRTLVRAGFGVLLLAWGLIAMAIYLPAAPFWQNQQAFSSVLGTTNRIILASLVAYSVSQTFDIWAFSKFREITSARHLWLRNNLSTLLSQSLDTVLFITIAFYGELPVIPLMLGQLTVKYAIAILDTPVVYGLIHLVRIGVGDGKTPLQAHTR